MHSDQLKKDGISESKMQALIMSVANYVIMKALYYGFRDAIIIYMHVQSCIYVLIIIIIIIIIIDRLHVLIVGPSRGWSVRFSSLAGAWKADVGPWRHVMAESIKLYI